MKSRRDVHLRVWCVCLGVAVATCGRSPTSPGSTEVHAEQHTGYALEYIGADRAVAESLVPMIDRGRQTAEQFFGTTYSATFVVKILHDRDALNVRWRVAFQQPGLQTRCWEIAGGWATEFDILSPAVWNSQACGHDGTNANHVANVVAHELVHVLHGQRNPSFFSIAASTPWILEGLAAYASGQWAVEYASSARSALSGGFAPTTFAEIWTSSANYALAGSVFAYIHPRFGTDAVRGLLTVGSEGALLTSLSTDATTLLQDWRAWVLAQQ
jgi:hypothetical protein